MEINAFGLIELITLAYKGFYRNKRLSYALKRHPLPLFGDKDIA